MYGHGVTEVHGDEVSNRCVVCSVFVYKHRLCTCAFVYMLVYVKSAELCSHKMLHITRIITQCRHIQQVGVSGLSAVGNLHHTYG